MEDGKLGGTATLLSTRLACCTGLLGSCRKDSIHPRNLSLLLAPRITTQQSQTEEARCSVQYLPRLHLCLTNTLASLSRVFGMRVGNDGLRSIFVGIMRAVGHHRARTTFLEVCGKNRKHGVLLIGTYISGLSTLRHSRRCMRWRLIITFFVQYSTCFPPALSLLPNV